MSRTRILLWHWGDAGAGSKFTLELASALVRMGRIPCCLSAARESELAARVTSQTTFAVRLVPAPPRGGVGPRFFTKALRCLGFPAAVTRMLDETRPGVALCTMQTIWDLFALPALRRRGIRYVLILHDAWFRAGDTYPLRAWALRRQVAASDGLIVLSNHVEKVAQSTFAYPTSRIIAIPHGAYHFEACAASLPRERQRGTPLHLLFVGRIVAYKGLGLLLNAYDLARRRGANVVLSIFGDGDVSALSRQMAELPNLQLENRWLTEAEIASALRCCDVVVLPYVEATQSGIAAGAFAAGLPCIATPVGGLVEQISDGRTGLIAAAMSAKALADTIVRLSEDDELYADLSRGALQHAREDLSWDKVAAKTLNFLDAIHELPARSGYARTQVWP